jgi:hypothetical protein
MINQEIVVDISVPPSKYWLVGQGQVVFEDDLAALGKFGTIPFRFLSGPIQISIYVHPDDHERAREKLRRKFDKATWPPPCASS